MLRAVKNIVAAALFDDSSSLHHGDPVGHLFDRQYTREGEATDLAFYTPSGTPEQRDSWNRVWTFLDWNLRPYQSAVK